MNPSSCWRTVPSIPTRSVSEGTLFSRLGFPRLRVGLVLVGLGILLGGCNTSGYYPVSGRVTDANSQPIPGLAGSPIVFNGDTSSVGEIKDDGSFQLFTERPGDGV